MKVFARHASIWIQPVLGVAPEALNAVDVIAPLRTALLLAHDDVIALDAQAGIGLPVVRVVETAWRGVGADQRDDLIGAACRYRESTHLAVTLDNAHHQHLAGRTPAALALAVAAEDGLIAFDRPVEGLAQILGVSAAGPQLTVEAFPRRRTGVRAKALAIHRHAQGEHLNEPVLDRRR